MITIITVTYNAVHTLERTLQSVEAQTLTDLQHIIMDGGSRDGTVQLAEAYRERVAGRYGVTVVSERDGGLYDAMNKAMALATGAFLCFLNAGDRLHGQDTLMQVAQTVADNPDAAVVYGETDLVDDSGRFLRHRRLQAPQRLSWRSFRHGMLVCHQSFYVRRSIAPAYCMDYRFSADFDWCIRCMKLGSTAAVTDATTGRIAVLTDYLSEGMTTANHRASLLERLRIMAKHYGWPTAVAMHAWFVVRGIILK